MRWSVAPNTGAQLEGRTFAAMHQAPVNSACRYTPPFRRIVRSTSDRASMLSNPEPVFRSSQPVNGPWHAGPTSNHIGVLEGAARPPRPPVPEDLMMKLMIASGNTSRTRIALATLVAAAVASLAVAGTVTPASAGEVIQHKPSREGVKAHKVTKLPTRPSQRPDRVSAKPGKGHADRAPAKPGKGHADRAPAKPGKGHADRAPAKPGKGHADRAPAKPGKGHADRAPAKPGKAHTVIRDFRDKRPRG